MVANQFLHINWITNVHFHIKLGIPLKLIEDMISKSAISSPSPKLRAGKPLELRPVDVSSATGKRVANPSLEEN